MMTLKQTVLTSERLELKILNVDDVSSKYVGWLNDPEINRFLETRFHEQTFESSESFVHQMVTSDQNYLFGIFHQGSHIGNVKLGFLNHHHKRAQISYFLGDRSMWGKGFATEAVKLVTKWGFEVLELTKIEAGCYARNLASLNLLMKCGYQVEGFLRNHVQDDSSRTGVFMLGILKHELV